MAMVLTEDQTLLKNSAAEFCKAQSPIESMRDLRDNKDETGYSAEIWQAMVDMGWTGAIFPEELGGFGFGYQGIGLAMEETGKTLVNSPLLSHAVLSGSLIMCGGTDAQKEELIPAIITAEQLYTAAIDEGAAHDPARIAMTATKSGDGYTLSGEKKFVLDGHTAGQLIVAARTSGNAGDESGITLFLVDAKASGVTVTRTHMVDSKNMANISFDNAPATAVFGEVDRGFAPLNQALDRARVCLAAEMLGGCIEVFDVTIEYMKTRVQFDVAIGTFQALQHRAAEVFGEVEMAKSVVLEALTAIDEGSGDVPLLASLAKAKLNDIYHLVSSEGIQLHGGIGMTDECNLGFYLKRSRVASQTFGSSRYHRNRYATLKGY